MSTSYKEILRCPLAGTNLDTLKLCVGMKVGSPVRPYSHVTDQGLLQIKLYYFTAFLGYVPTYDNELTLLKHHQSGNKIYAYITEYNKDNPARFPLYIGFKVKINEEQSQPTDMDIPL